MIQLAAPKDSIHHFYRLKKEGYALRVNSEKNQQQAFNESNQKFNLSNFSQFSLIGVDYQQIPAGKQQQDDSALNISGMLKQTNLSNKIYDSPIDIKDHASKDQFYTNLKNSDRMLQSGGARAKFFDDQSKMSPPQETDRFTDNLELDGQEIFWLEKASLETILEYLSLFRVDLKISPNYWLDNQTLYSADTADKRGTPSEALIEEQQDEYPADRYYYAENEELALGDLNPSVSSGNGNRKGKPIFQEDNNVDLDDLGIIELEEDEEWMEYADELAQKRVHSNQAMSRSRTSQRSETYSGGNSNKMPNNGSYYYKNNRREINEGGSPTALGQHQNYDYQSRFDPSQRLTPAQFKDLHQQQQQQQGYGRGGPHGSGGRGLSPTRANQNIIHVVDDFTSTQKPSEIIDHQLDKMSSNLREKAVLRPQNQLFRPLTPPVKNQTQHQPKEGAAFIGYDDGDEQEEVETEGRGSRYQNNRKRYHHSGGRMEAPDQLYQQPYPSRSLKESHSSTQLEVIAGSASPKNLIMGNESDSSQSSESQIPFYDHSEPPETFAPEGLSKDKSDPEITVVKSPTNASSSKAQTAADDELKSDENRLKVPNTKPGEVHRDKAGVDEKSNVLDKKGKHSREVSALLNEKASKPEDERKKERYPEVEIEDDDESHPIETKGAQSSKQLSNIKKESSSNTEEHIESNKLEGVQRQSDPSSETFSRPKGGDAKLQRPRDPTPVEKSSTNPSKQSRDKEKTKTASHSAAKEESRSKQANESQQQQQSAENEFRKLQPEESKKSSQKYKTQKEQNNNKGLFRFPESNSVEHDFEDEVYEKDHSFENFKLSSDLKNQFSKFTGSLSSIQRAVEGSKHNSDRKEKSLPIPSTSFHAQRGESAATGAQLHQRGSPSSATKNKTMKNILKKAAKILKEEQTGLNEFLDKQEMILKTTGIHIKDNLNLMDQLLVSLQKEGKGQTKMGLNTTGTSNYVSETNKRSISAEKNAKNIVPKPQPLTHLSKGQGMLTTIQPFMSKSPAYGRSPGSNRKNPRDKKGSKKLGTFMPGPSLAPKVQSVKGKYVTPLRNNFLSQDDPSLLNKSDLNNQTL